MSTASTSSTTSASTYNGLSTQTASSVTELGDNYDMFIKLLTAQLKNQNPLDPTDTDQLTQQMVSFSEVEQSILTNQYLENLVLSTSNESSQVALSFLGKQVTYDASSQEYNGSSLSWGMEIPEDSTSVSFEVQNEDGLTVYKATEDDLDSGNHTFTWDGSTTAGGSPVEGTKYKLVVVSTDASGDTSKVTLQSTSIASQVDWSTGTPQLVLKNGATVALSTIITARAVDTDA
ncbi:flagellar hook assembly protein FlgD [Pararhodospirillum photometricum]|nr:flagellar hook capping FlgD N-terminal domain-containing protein [Pararhodospirillum photometricum]